MSALTKTALTKIRKRLPRVLAMLQVVATEKLVPWKEAFRDLIERKSEVGAYIAGLRYRVGFTQKQLAEILGCTQTMISRLENGSRKPTDVLIRKMSQLFKSHYGAFSPEQAE